MSKNAIINQQNDYDIQQSLLEDEILLEVGNLEKLKEEQAKIESEYKRLFLEPVCYMGTGLKEPPEDKALLKDYTLTLANNTVTDGGGSYTWTGKVFLPTYTQMGFGNNNSISEGIQFNKFTNNTSRIKSLHPNCIANNEYCKINIYNYCSFCCFITN